MSGKLITMAGLAIVFGGTSYFAGNKYLEGQTQARIDQLESRSGSNFELVEIVVATKPLKFGEKINQDSLKMVTWPKAHVPKGSYTSMEKLVGKGERKVIQPIEPNEPVLKVKITGDNDRAGLAGIISDGMRAVTIPVNSIDGVGGFVMPGDRVDIIFSRRSRKSGGQTARVIMENVKVLTVDQRAGSRSDGPKVAKSVTLETDATGAQKLALANNTGKLSLLLRGAGDAASIGTKTISFDDLGISPKKQDPLEPEVGDEEDNEGFLSFLRGKEQKKTTTSVRVIAGDQVKDRTVPIHKELRKQQ